MEEVKQTEQNGTETQKKGVKAKWTNIAMAVLSILVVLSLTWLALNIWVLIRHEVNGVSMTPTITNGQMVWGNKIKEPKRFDVVSINAKTYITKFNNDHGLSGANALDAEILLKRVVGVAGDTLSMEMISSSQGWIRIERNGEEFMLLDDEDYGKGKLMPLSHWTYDNNWGFTIEVPDGYIFAVGDLRGKYSGPDTSYVGKGSVDSRYLGLIAVKDVIAVIYGFKG